MDNEKKDYSTQCNLDDEDMNNPCRKCKHFIFPIGCMLAELSRTQQSDTDK